MFDSRCIDASNCTLYILWVKRSQSVNDNWASTRETLSSGFQPGHGHVIDYGSITWGGTSLVNLERVLKLQKRVARIMLNADFSTPSKDMFDLLKWMPIHKRLLYSKATLTDKALNGLTPEYITNILTPNSTGS